MSKISGILEEMTIRDFDNWRPEVVVFGIGSTEPHGAALPYGTDAIIAAGVTRRATMLANKRGARVLQYPTLPISCNVNFKAFPFASRIKVRTFMNLLADVIQALEEDGVRKIVIHNCHGGNKSVIEAALREHFDRYPGEAGGRRAFVCSSNNRSFISAKEAAAFTHPSPHAGETESAAVLGLRPELVRTELFSDPPIVKPSAPGIAESDDKIHYVKPWHLHLPASAGGEQRTVTRDMGERYINALAEGLADFLVRLSAAPWHKNFPFDPPFAIVPEQE